MVPPCPMPEKRGLTPPLACTPPHTVPAQHLPQRGSTESQTECLGTQARSRASLPCSAESALHVLNALAQTQKLSAGNRIGNGLKQVHNREARLTWCVTRRS